MPFIVTVVCLHISNQCVCAQLFPHQKRSSLNIPSTLLLDNPEPNPETPLSAPNRFQHPPKIIPTHPDMFRLRATLSLSQDGEKEMPAGLATASAGVGDTGRADNPPGAQV